MVSGARTICYLNATGILLFFVGFIYARKIFPHNLFLIAATLVSLVAISMIAPLSLAKTETTSPD